MATKKPTTKAKTKTSAARVKTATSKTRKAATTKKAVASAKTITKSAPKKVSGATSASSRFAGMGANLMALRRLHILAAALFVLLALVAGTVMNNTSASFTLGHVAKDELHSGLVSAAQPIFDIELKWLVVAVMMFSTVLPVLYVTKLEKRYHAYLQGSRMVPWRWLDLAVTGALMLETTAVLSGVHDLFVLKLIGGLVGASCLFGLIAERQNDAAPNRMVWSAYAGHLFSAVMPWVLVWAAAISTIVYGGGARMAWYIYALYAGGFIALALTAVNQFGQYRRAGAWQNYLAVERNYLVVSFLAKAAFAIILITGLR